MSSIISTSTQQTKQIGADFAHTLKGGEVILLEGDLGAGKTTFVQGLVGAFSHDHEVRSPTYTIVNIYPISHDRIKQVVHADLYRIKSASELPMLGLEELLDRKDTVVLIEWPNIFEANWHRLYFRVKIDHNGDERIINYSNE